MAAALYSAAQHQAVTRFEEAVADFELAENAAVQLGDHEAQINAMYGKAVVLFYSKRLREVAEQAARARTLAEAAGSPVAMASSDVMLAIEPFCTGELLVAQELFDRAIPVLRERGPVNHALDAVSYRGLLHFNALEYDQADLFLDWTRQRAGEFRVGFNLLIAIFHRARMRGNQGRLSEASAMLDEASRFADLLDDRFWRPAIANTRGWLRGELLDTEAALRLNTEAVQVAREFGHVEAECNSHINAARDYLTLGDPAHAWEHLRQAEARYEQDVWFRWIYYPRLQAELASYWMARGDLLQALATARVSLEHANRTRSRKRMAWAHKLLGDIAVLEDRPDDAWREYQEALHLLEHHACPTIEWQILRAALIAAGARDDAAARDELLGRARAVVQALADSVRDDASRRVFLHSKPIRELLH